MPSAPAPVPSAPSPTASVSPPLNEVNRDGEPHPQDPNPQEPNPPDEQAQLVVRVERPLPAYRPPQPVPLAFLHRIVQEHRARLSARNPTARTPASSSVPSTPARPVSPSSMGPQTQSMSPTAAKTTNMVRSSTGAIEDPDEPWYARVKRVPQVQSAGIIFSERERDREGGSRVGARVGSPLPHSRIATPSRPRDEAASPRTPGRSISPVAAVPLYLKGTKAPLPPPFVSSAPPSPSRPFPPTPPRERIESQPAGSQPKKHRLHPGTFRSDSNVHSYPPPIAQATSSPASKAFPRSPPGLAQRPEWDFPHLSPIPISGDRHDTPNAESVSRTGQVSVPPPSLPLPPAPPPLPEVWEEPVQPPENFTMVSSWIYRSSFPSRRHFSFLRTLGLRTMLTLVLETYPDGHTQWLRDEGIGLMQFGLPGNKEPFVHIPPQQIAAALAALLDRRNHPILVHCNKGKHRTGCLVGCLRKLQQWSLTAIFEEYRRFATPKPRAMDQEFIELFDTRLVWAALGVNAQWLPHWLVLPLPPPQLCRAVSPELECFEEEEEEEPGMRLMRGM